MPVPPSKHLEQLDDPEVSAEATAAHGVARERTQPAALLSLPAEDLAAGPPTAAFFQRLLTEIAAQEKWTARLAERLDYAYSEILLRAVAAGRTGALRRLGEHLGRVIAIRRDEITRRGSPYFDRWQLLHELAERRVLKRETAEAVLESAWVGDVLRTLHTRGRPMRQCKLGPELGIKTKSRLTQVLSDMERWELIERRKGTLQSKREKLVWLTQLGRIFARKHAEQSGELRAAPVQPAPNAPAAPVHVDRNSRDDKWRCYDGGGFRAIFARAAA